MENALVEFIDKFGYFAVFLLIFIENIFPPIPSEVVLVMGGFATTYADMNVFIVIVSATIGSTVGAAVLYMLGRFLPKEKIKNIFSGKFGKILHTKPDDIEKAETWFKKYEYRAVLICRCIPVIRSLISIPAGMAKMKPIPFFILTFIGSAIWNTVLVIIGAIGGDAVERNLMYIEQYSTALVISLVIVLMLYVIIKKIKRKKEEDK